MHHWIHYHTKFEYRKVSRWSDPTYSVRYSRKVQIMSIWWTLSCVIWTSLF